MDRRQFLGLACAAVGAGGGCRGHQKATVLSPDKADAVGSHAAGAETYKPLVDEAVGKLLARQQPGEITLAGGVPGPKRVCFVGLENRSSEDLGDFKDHVVELIDNRINSSGAFVQISRRFTEAGLREARVRPDDLFVPANQRRFLAAMESQGQPFEYLLFATITSGTTRDNDASQKDYQLTLELVDLRTGTPDKESACLRKGYRKSLLR